MTRGLDISVVLATFNRSNYLRQTLEAMCEVDCRELNVEFVIVDNNSSDDTARIIDAFTERLPLRHLFEARPGKNCALNHAIDTAELGRIVVFTDDDVVPRKDWLKEVLSACDRWPEYDVFGGKIELIWPHETVIPRWAKENEYIRGIGFAEHDLGKQARPYEPSSVPSGPNFWVRATVLRDGMRYNESIGPRPGQKFGMGSETEFLMRLAAQGRKFLYVPTALVCHHVQVSLLDSRSMLRRAVRMGRGEPHTRGLPDPDRLARSRWRWRLRRLAAMSWHLVRFGVSMMRRDECVRMDQATRALRFFAYHREALLMSWRGDEGGAEEHSAGTSSTGHRGCQSACEAQGLHPHGRDTDPGRSLEEKP